MISQFEILHYETVDSTNAEAKRLVAHGKAPEFAVAALAQTAGRGRFQRAWLSPPGNLALTIVVRAPRKRPDLPTVALVTGLALLDMLDASLPAHVSAQVKWPNDILLGGAKLSGTLIESDAEHMFVGIGINTTSAPPNMPYPTIALSRYGQIDHDDLVKSTILAWRRRFLLWQSQGFGPMQQDYNSRLFGRQRTIEFTFDRETGENIRGLCLGIDALGRFGLQKQDGQIIYRNAGEVLSVC